MTILYKDSPLKILISYAYWKHKDLESFLENETAKGTNYEILIDSGAFTVFNAKKPPIDIDDYCRFLDRVLNKNIKIKGYFTLDVIGDGKQTYKQYELLRARGFNPIPIFTKGEELCMVEEYYKTSDIVGFGNLVGNKTADPFIKMILTKYVKGRKCHLLGVAKPHILYGLKPYSCDSSKLTMGMRFGAIDVCNGLVCKKHSRVDFVKPTKELLRYIRTINPQHYTKLSQKNNWCNDLSWTTNKNDIPAVVETSYRSWILFSLNYYKIKVNYWNAVSDKDIPTMFTLYKDLIHNILPKNK